ncbi:PepSY domain-containing protein [Glaciecola sp. 1036]|uniref:PepSY domain-containing protein n=1 Tax=Alteromonadaceae TaxID=72275 RepID=UPI003D015246
MRVSGWQWAIWAVTGCFMVLINIHQIRGDNFVKPTPSVRVSDFSFPLSEVINNSRPFLRIDLEYRLQRPVYKFVLSNIPYSIRLVDAKTGQEMPVLTESQVMEIAVERNTMGFIEEDIKHIALSDELPDEVSSRYKEAFIVEFKGWQSHTFYIEPVSGEIVTKRYWGWRVFDWMWKFHIMDYDDGANPQNWLIKLLSVLALMAFVCGFCFLCFRILCFKKPFAIPAMERKNSRKLNAYMHRFTALVCLAPVTIWLVTGSYLVWFEGQKPEPIPIQPPEFLVSSEQVVFSNFQFGSSINRASVVSRLNNWFVEIEANTPQEAMKNASQIYTLNMQGPVEINELLITQSLPFKPHSFRDSDSFYPYEHRVISFVDEQNVRHYLDASTASYVGASNLKSLVDTWMLRLHFLDFSGEGHFNHLWNKVFAFIFILLSVTGLIGIIQPKGSKG